MLGTEVEVYETMIVCNKLQSSSSTLVTGAK